MDNEETTRKKAEETWRIIWEDDPEPIVIIGGVRIPGDRDSRQAQKGKTEVKPETKTAHTPTEYLFESLHKH